MNIKMIVLDMDGTLLEDDHATISERNQKALQKAAEQGIRIVLASGRTYTWMADIIEQIPFVDDILTSNGAGAVHVKTGEAIFSAGISYDKWVQAYEIFKKYGRFFEMYVDGQAYMERDSLAIYRNDAVAPEMVAWLKSKFIPVEDARSYFKGKYMEKLACLDEDVPEFHQMKAELQALGTLAFSSGLEGSMEMNDKDTSKGSGLSLLCEKLGILPEEVMAFGDSSNDVTMLEFAGYSYAMGNALEEAKQAAKYMAPSNMEDGVAQIVEKILK